MGEIDILMASYNSEEFITAQLDSLMKQTFTDFRLIIRDDCSLDRTFSLIESFAKNYPGKIKLIKGECNLGAAGNFAALSKMSDAKYVMFSDGDDVWIPTKIEVSLELMKKLELLHGSHTPLLVHTDLMVVDKNLNPLSPSFWNYSCLNPKKASTLNRLLTQNALTGCTLLLNKPLLDLSNPIPKESIMHDWWIGLVASAFGHIALVDKPTILYRQHGRNEVGANPFRLRNFCHLSKKKEHCRNQTYQQARCLLERYRTLLTGEQKKILKAYTEMEGLSYFHKKGRLIKYRFFKQGFFRNLRLLVFSK